ncbi:tetratricopeptide repeat protein [Rhodovulum sp. DZ06]|uniref:tetratricopeptide repeat protein n=1 Tax=Rhodovulum sp. DZ06 TaxID=3425126 RepID=UPI003D325B95
MNAKVYRRVATALAAGAVMVGMAAQAQAASRSLAGAYLAARQASQRNDMAAAADYWTQALALNPSSHQLRGQALNFKVLVGDFKTAAVLASALVNGQPGHRLAHLTLAADAFTSRAYDTALDRIETAPEGAFPPLLASLLSGWAHAGLGEAEAAKAAFMSGAGEGVAMYDLFGGYHWGLAQMAMGDPEAAAETFRETAEAVGGAGARMTRAHGLALEAAGRREAALELWRGALASGQADALIEHELDRMERGETGAIPVADARDGAAEGMFSIAGALSQDQTGAAALLYSQFALFLRPDMHEARLLAAELLADQGQAKGAADNFAKIPLGSPFHVSAEIGRAEALRKLERTDEAIIALKALAEIAPESRQAHIALGDLLRREERFAEAADAYTDAIDLMGEPDPRHWALYYQRGISNERSGAWEQAEKDFLTALDLQPGQPLALNYLGYSWVEQRRNLDEALDMIERAVAQRPQDGYITDSLGWVLYRMDRHEEAVPHLERAVELTPVDPVINDHLGDALWMVGRKREARFQWRRALSFEPEQEEADRIRRKLAKGLDAVLRDEAAEATADGGDAAQNDG